MPRPDHRAGHSRVRARSGPLDSPAMVDIDEHGRPEPPLAADETATVIGFLEYQRATFAWRCAGLDAAALRATVAPSAMTLGGMLKHMAFVEDHWFSRNLYDRERMPPFDAVDWKADPDWEWHSAARDSAAELLALWQDAVERSRDLLARALVRGDLD